MDCSHYHWTLYSAGLPQLDVNKDASQGGHDSNRDRDNSWLLGDPVVSQLVKEFGKVIERSSCPKHKRNVNKSPAWMDAYMDYGMILIFRQFPDRSRSESNRNYKLLQDAPNATRINNDYFMKNRNGNCKF